jgi:hypothetical protein
LLLGAPVLKLQRAAMIAILIAGCAERTLTQFQLFGRRLYTASRLTRAPTSFTSQRTELSIQPVLQPATLAPARHPTCATAAATAVATITSFNPTNLLTTSFVDYMLLACYY